MLESIRPGLLALRRYWKPFVLIQVCAFGVVVAYFSSASVRAGAEVLAAWKVAVGVIGAAVVSAVSGAIMPELAKAIALRDTVVNRKRINDIAFAAMIFGTVGVVGHYFFPFQASLFGEDARWITTLKKMAFDQFVYTPFFTLPVIAFLFTLRESGWSLSAAAGNIDRTWYGRRVVPLLVLCWCYWIPMCMLMYSLPTNLVFCFAMFAQAAWSILMLFAGNHPREPEVTAPLVADEVVRAAA